MTSSDWFAVTKPQVLRFFFERLRDVAEEDASPDEVLYNASVLAHFAVTSTGSGEFPSTPSSLSTVFDLFVLDRSRCVDPQVAETAGAQILFLTGFFHNQMRRRHNLQWYASLGASFYDVAARLAVDRARARMMQTMALKFGLWRERQHRLATELGDEAKLIRQLASDN